jgi:hypothetical protein
MRVGTVTDTQVLLLIGAQFSIIATALGIWWRIEGRIRAAETAAIIKAEAAVASVHLVAANLASHQLHTAETYVTKSGLRETTEQLMGAIGEVKAQMTGMTTRLDRIIESRGTPPHP